MPLSLHLRLLCITFLLHSAQFKPVIREASTETATFAVCPFSETLNTIAQYGKCDGCKEAIKAGSSNAAAICAEEQCCARMFIGLTSHFFTCHRGCCTRLVSLQAAPDSGSDQIAAILQMQTIVNNEFTLKNSTNGVCFFEDGPNPSFGDVCAGQFQNEELYKGRKSAQVPVWGANMLNPPCSGLYPDVDPPSALGSGDGSSLQVSSGDEDKVVFDDGGSDGDSDGASTQTDDDDDGDGDGDGDDDGDGDGDGDGDDNDDDDDDQDVVIVNGGGLFDTSTSEDESTMNDGNTHEGALAGTEQNSKSEGACFPSDAAVMLVRRGMVRMDELNVGDIIVTRPNRCSRVIGFTHAESRGLYEFVEITIDTGLSLRLSQDHFLYANGKILRARDLNPGDFLMSTNGLARTVAVGRCRRHGLYNPQTMDGDILVDGIVATTYTEEVGVAAGHALLAPIRVAAAIGKRSALSTIISDVVTSFSEIWQRFDKLRGSKVPARY